MALTLLSTYAKPASTTPSTSTSTQSSNNTGSTSFDSLLNPPSTASKNITKLQKLGYGTLSKATTVVGMIINLNAAQTAVAAGGYDVNTPKKSMAGGGIQPSYIKSLSVVDAKGVSHSLQVGFLKTDANQWSVEVIAVPATDTKYTTNGRVARGTLEFNDDGSLKSVSQNLLKPTHIQWANGSKENVITFDYGKPGAYEGLTAFATDYATTSLTQDGATTGKLVSAQIGKNNKATLSYDNSLTKQITLPPNFSRL